MTAKTKKQQLPKKPAIPATVAAEVTAAVAGDIVQPPGVRHVRAYLAAFILAVLLFTASTWNALADKAILGWEFPVFNFINDLPDGLRLAGLAATVTPESTLIGAIVVVAAFLFKKYRLSWRLAVGTIGGYAVVAIAKHLVARSRPAEVLSDVHLRAHDTGMGFPSGHTMIVTVIMLMLLPYIPGKWKLLVPLPIIAMAWSRIYLGLHAPLDIIGGFAIGLGVVCFLRILPRSIAKFTRLD
jgi:membrane-associated phospholipid phosphatase